MRTPRFDYLKCQRHILLDMHVPDWDEGFLAKFDATRMVDLYARSGADAVMHYCNSHVGLNYWPSSVGQMHRGLGGRDMVRETVDELHKRGIASCAYYSSYFNNWAWTNHPDWRLVGAGPGTLFGPKSRYGVCCPTSQGYHAFQLTQVDELARTYPFDAFFFDMVFWTDICICESCQARFKAETGERIPETVDWTSPSWCAFAAARERWLTEAFAELSAAVKRHADIPVFNNVTCLDKSWQQGVVLDAVKSQDLLGGDFGVLGNDTYAASHIFARATPTVMQYMNAFTGYIGGASYLIDAEEQFVHHALLALLFSGQFMAIDAVESDGTVNSAYYTEELAEVFTRMKPYEAFVGGKPVIDVAVYFSDASRMALEENGMPIGNVGGRQWAEPPHMRALRGAIRALRLRHIPVGAITKRELGDLARYAVVVLPNAVRLSEEEIAAFRTYVQGGGKLYASGDTSRLTLDGKLGDFALADLFGCRFVDAESRPTVYVEPQEPSLKAAIAPRRAVSHGSPRSTFRTRDMRTLRIRPEKDAQVLARLVLPYGKGTGHRENQEWSSIHASPPYVKTGEPVILRRKVGRGEVIYSAADIEANWAPLLSSEQAADRGPANLFAQLIEDLLGKAPLTFGLEADEGVMAVAFDDRHERRLRLHIANIPPSLPARPVPRINLHLRAPEGRRIRTLRILPGRETLAHQMDADGTARAEIRNLEHFCIVAAEYE